MPFKFQIGELVKVFACTVSAAHDKEWRDGIVLVRERSGKGSFPMYEVLLADSLNSTCKRRVGEWHLRVA